MSNLPFTLDQLKIFYRICEEGSFKKAAERLYISQPAVSLQIQNLEKQLNVPVFSRNGRSIKLTENGHLLKRYSEKIIDLCEEACQALDELYVFQSGTISIGASQTTGTYLMPRLIGILKHKYPNIKVELVVNSTKQIAWAVAKGQIDLAIVGGQVPIEIRNVLEVTPYAEDELALILPTSHPFSSLDYIRKDDLYRLRFIGLKSHSSTSQEKIKETLYKKGIDSSYFNIELELDSVESIKTAVQSGLGASFVSVSSISKELELKMLHWAKIEGITIKRNLLLLTSPQKNNSNFTNLLKDELLQMFILSGLK